MIHLTHLSWTSSLAIATAMPIGHWETALGLLFIGLLTFLGFRERYLIVWLGG